MQLCILMLRDAACRELRALPQLRILERQESDEFTPSIDGPLNRIRTRVHVERRASCRVVDAHNIESRDSLASERTDVGETDGCVRFDAEFHARGQRLSSP